jgi:hypothetical protein
MNRRFVWLWGLATVAIAAVVGVGAYIAGTANHVVTTTGGDGTVYYGGHWGFGFFPFFGLFWILLIGFLLFRFAFWRPWGRGPWGYGGGYWHQHPQEHGDTPAKPNQPNQPDQTANV